MPETAIDHPNVTLFRRGYDAFNSGDMEAVRATFADDIVWHTQGRSRFSGDQRGIENTLALFMELIQATNGTWKLEVHDIVANDEHAVALVTSSYEIDGKQHSDNAAHIVHVKDGKVTESWFHAWNPYDFDEVFPATNLTGS